MKIFCIGLNKTGTTTLGHCLGSLGFKHRSFNLALLEQVAISKYDQLHKEIVGYESFSDWPYPFVYEYLDRSYPGSRFILTRRATPEVWLDSLFSHSLRADPIIGSRARSLAYGYPYPQLNPKAHISFYTKHLQTVRDYFFGRQDDFLEVCWEEGSSFIDLCTFLDRGHPNQDLPHSNRRENGNLMHKDANIRLLRWYENRIKGANHPLKPDDFSTIVH
jgi:hypothetical protein